MCLHAHRMLGDVEDVLMSDYQYGTGPRSGGVSRAQAAALILKDTYVSRGELHPDAAVFLDAALR